jgi:uncharacterized protein (TIGR02598 family)
MSPLISFPTQKFPGRPSRVCGRKAFSLVEVTISLGIVSFAVLSILGLLPTGLNTLRASMDETIRAQIMKSMAANAVIADFESLSNGSTNYFDDEGILVQNQNQAYYTVVTVPADPLFPGSASAPSLGEHLSTLNVEISRSPTPGDPLISLGSFPLQIARNTPIR